MPASQRAFRALARDAVEAAVTFFAVALKRLREAVSAGTVMGVRFSKRSRGYLGQVAPPSRTMPDFQKDLLYFPALMGF